MTETHGNRTETHACDLISRQAAIDAVDESLKRVFVYPVGEKILGKVPSAQQWIPCSERSAEMPCLACDGYQQIFIPTEIATINGKCYDGRNYNFDPEEFLKGEVLEMPGGLQFRILPREIVAWMPLPEPYEVTP